MTNARVDWRGEEVVALLSSITLEGLLQAGYQVEAEAKIGAAVDTGFMRNSVYVHSDKASTFRARSEEIDGRLHETTNAPPEPGDGVIVGVGADYAIYVEAEQPFLYPALVRVARQVGAMIQGEARGKL